MTVMSWYGEWKGCNGCIANHRKELWNWGLWFAESENDIQNEEDWRYTQPIREEISEMRFVIGWTWQWYAEWGGLKVYTAN